MYIHYFLPMQTSKLHTNQYIMIFWSARWVPYQYIIHVMCCTAVPAAHTLQLYCLFQCTFTRHTSYFSFPWPADA